MLKDANPGFFAGIYIVCGYVNTDGLEHSARSFRADLPLV